MMLTMCICSSLGTDCCNVFFLVLVCDATSGHNIHRLPGFLTSKESLTLSHVGGP